MRLDRSRVAVVGAFALAVEACGAGNARCWHVNNTCFFPVPRPTNSELWQRLRAARELARKSREDVAAAVGVDEKAVALWESEDRATRVPPSAQQVMRIAKLCELPLYLLVDDAVSIEDIRSFTGP